MITYISVDVETTGDIPGYNTLLSIGAAAFTEKDGLVSTFETNLDALPDAVNNPETMGFWAKWPEAFAATRINTVLPEVGGKALVNWLKTFSNAVFIFYPTKFDSMWLYYFLYRFGGMSFLTSPDSIDIKTYAMVTLGEVDVSCAGKRNWPKRWKSKKRHKHIALSDAIEQGESFMKMLRENPAPCSLT